MNGEIDKRNKRLHELSAKLCLSGIGSMTERELFELVEMYAFGVQCPSARESMMRKYKSYAELIRSDGRGDGSLVQGFIRLVQESALVLARGSDPAHGAGGGKKGGAAANAARFLQDERQMRLREICRSLAGRFYDSTVESFRATYLDSAGRWLMCEEIAEGTVGEVRVDTRRVFRRALELGASGLLLSHNHPSGDLMPSAADMRFTDRIRVACESVGIELADHVIVSDGFAYGKSDGSEQLGHTGVYRSGEEDGGAVRPARSRARTAAPTVSGGSEDDTEQLSLLLDVKDEPISPSEE